MMKSRDFRSKNGVFRVTVNWYTIFSTLLTLAMTAVLLFTVAYLPPFGDPTNPPNNETAQRYVEKGTDETGVVNTIAGMILNYRGFDTFGEATILFIAVEGVMWLIRKKYNPELEEEDEQSEITQ